MNRMGTRVLRTVWGLLLAGILAGPAWSADPASALWSGGGEPLRVEADSLEIRGAEQLVLFQGHVRAVQGRMELEADALRVRVDPDNRDVREAVARGNVRIRQGEVLATGALARYDAARGIVVLEGEPKVWRGKDVVAGRRITLYLAEDRTVVEGARAVLYPGKEGEEQGP